MKIPFIGQKPVSKTNLQVVLPSKDDSTAKKTMKVMLHVLTLGTIILAAALIDGTTSSAKYIASKLRRSQPSRFNKFAKAVKTKTSALVHNKTAQRVALGSAVVATAGYGAYATGFASKPWSYVPSLTIPYFSK